jgi:hypothetical protein
MSMLFGTWRDVPARRKIGCQPMWRDREHKLDLADIGGEPGVREDRRRVLLSGPHAMVRRLARVVGIGIETADIARQ